MNLIADIGNTATKLALFEGKEKVSVSRIRDLNCMELEAFISDRTIKRAIVSTVKILPPFVSGILVNNVPEVHFLSSGSKLPFSIEYHTPETLGTDRIAAVAGAYEIYPGKNVLIIDAGTAITYDFLSGRSFRGGNISPGISMRFKALNKFTGLLPMINSPGEYSQMGQSTEEAITSGVMSGVIFEINEYIRTFLEKDPDLKVILSGGDGEMLSRKINHAARYIPDLVIDGLNYILEYNA
jgi:type III pantothenate kinase